MRSLSNLLRHSAVCRHERVWALRRNCRPRTWDDFVSRQRRQKVILPLEILPVVGLGTALANYCPANLGESHASARNKLKSAQKKHFNHRASLMNATLLQCHDLWKLNNYVSKIMGPLANLMAVNSSFGLYEILSAGVNMYMRKILDTSNGRRFAHPFGVHVAKKQLVY